MMQTPINTYCPTSLAFAFTYLLPMCQLPLMSYIVHLGFPPSLPYKQSPLLSQCTWTDNTPSLDDTTAYLVVDGEILSTHQHMNTAFSLINTACSRQKSPTHTLFQWSIVFQSPTVYQLSP